MGINKAVLKEEMKGLPANKERADFFQYIYANYPEYRKFFKSKNSRGHEDMANNPFWQSHGARVLGAMHRLVDICDNPVRFYADLEELIIRHYKAYRIDANVWHDFSGLWEGYLRSMGVSRLATEWRPFCAAFAEVADNCAACGYSLA